MNKTFIRYLNWAFSLILAAILIGTFWPLPEKVQSMRINQSYLDEALIEQCPPLETLVGYEFYLTVPEQVWRSQENQIELDISPVQNTNNMLSVDNDLCNLTLEIKLDDMDNFRIEPGERIVVPFKGKFDQTFIFNITPDRLEPAEGELWINADIYDAEGTHQNHLPLFMIPLAVDVVSIFGLPPTLVRYICLFALMIQFVIAFRKRLFA